MVRPRTEPPQGSIGHFDAVDVLHPGRRVQTHFRQDGRVERFVELNESAAFDDQGPLLIALYQIVVVKAEPYIS